MSDDNNSKEERYEINNQGELVLDKPEVYKSTESQTFIEKIFSINAWECTVKDKTASNYLLELYNKNLNKEYKINLFLRNIRKEDPNRDIREKKIQLGNSDPRIEIPGYIPLILGVYTKSADAPVEECLLVNWPVESQKNYNQNPSLRVNMEKDMLPAKNIGYYHDTTTGKELTAFRPEFLYYFLDEYCQSHASINLSSPSDAIGVCGINRIIYGTPGCGKSYYLDNVVLKSYKKENIVRVTFHSEYTNSEFVGQIMPKLTWDESKKANSLVYSFVPGPMSTIVKLALGNTTETFALVIEEINRGNAASIFGDLFQLLDRADNGESRYSITNPAMQEYLSIELGVPIDEIKIPSNLSIYATMNISDQGVYTLDSAFKRRWSFEKKINIFSSDHPYKAFYVPGTTCSWEVFVSTINKKIIETADGFSSEDRQLGVYFVNQSDLVNPNAHNNHDVEEKTKSFAYKVLEYLWSDVAKYNRDVWFNNINSLDELLNQFINAESPQRRLRVFGDLFDGIGE